MQNFKRKITYFYEHHNGNVGSTAGFMKLEIRGDKVKIIINIQEPLGVSYKGADLYLYHEAGDHLSAVKVDDVESIDGVLTYQNRTDWQNIFRTERDLYTFDGVAVVYHDAHYYIGDFADKDRTGYQLTKKEKKPIIAQMIPEFVDEEEKDESVSLREIAGVATVPAKVEVASISEVSIDEHEVEKAIRKISDNEENKKVSDISKITKPQDSIQRKVESDHPSIDTICKDCPYQKKRQQQHAEENALEQMLETYPKLQMYGVADLFDCVRIHPRDIGKLDMRNWKLGVNSFLTHNFYTYQYLLLGKMRFDDGKFRYILGVPGVYSNREKYLANMFGFDQFIPIKQTGVKTGEFGYWIVEVMPSL